MDGIADHVFTSTVLHEVHPDQRIDFLTELAKLMKPDGRLTILDWASVDEVEMGPPAHIRLSRSKVEDLFGAANIQIERSEPFGSDFYIVRGIRR